ncbi:MAG TPA: nucleotidyl transferase AbiEii/AbiGii toxin family protein [Ignavibacteriales bacterium]|nr:nucleotidyl transferase AbiEii/AbiGii toxin family protein [Ignavibacteriales bacterium]
MKNSRFFNQAALLLRILPVINNENSFALKGGTAINFFVRDLPRLSVDIDLVYLPVEEREKSLTEISEAILRIENRLSQIIPGLRYQRKLNPAARTFYGLIVSSENAIVKVEPNTTIRGSVYPPGMLKLCSKAEELFELSLKVRSLSSEELYAGKICAALDRQHPRDLFDIKLLLENEGITDRLRKAFIVYLISHPRPIEEVLNPNRIDIRDVFAREFKGMTSEDIKLEELLEVRERLVEIIRLSLTDNEKTFLISFKNKHPEWSLLGLDDIGKMPAVKWKLENLNRMLPGKHKTALLKLEKYLKA